MFSLVSEHLDKMMFTFGEDNKTYRSKRITMYMFLKIKTSRFTV